MDRHMCCSVAVLLRFQHASAPVQCPVWCIHTDASAYLAVTQLRSGILYERYASLFKCACEQASPPHLEAREAPLAPLIGFLATTALFVSVLVRRTEHAYI